MFVLGRFLQRRWSDAHGGQRVGRQLVTRNRLRIALGGNLEAGASQLPIFHGTKLLAKTGYDDKEEDESMLRSRGFSLVLW
jgi:hypothetical protein